MNDSELAFERTLDAVLGAALVRLLSPFTRARQQDLPDGPRGVRRILLVKLHGVGNVVMALPALRAIRRHYPASEIDFLTFSTNASVLEGEPGISALHLLPREGTRKFLGSALRLLPRLRRGRYDMVIDFEQFAHVSALLGAVTGAPVRIGFRNLANRRDLLFTTPVAYLDTAHMSKTFERLARAAGAPASPGLSRRLTLDEAHVCEAAVFEAQNEIREEDLLVLAHPGSSANLTVRRWPEARFAELADRLAARFGAKIVLTGDRSEERLADRVEQAMRSPAVNAAGKLSLKGFAALCERAEFVISNDTAAVHVASAMGTPVVGLYGPNTPFLYGPAGSDDVVFYHEPPCSPCLVNINAKLSRCRDARCMDTITVDEVAAGISETFFDSSGTLKPPFKKRRPPGHRP